MSKYLCRSCAISGGYITRSLLPTYNATGDATGYQLDKFLKHTQTGYFTGGATSLFGDPAYENYKNYLIGASLSGHLEIDNGGRKSVYFYAGKEVGCYYDSISGFVKYPESGVRVVLYSNDAKIHGFTCNPSWSGTLTCTNCGCPLP